MYDDSHCPKGFYCEFEVSRSLPDVQIEVCVRCSKKVIYRKDGKGRVEKGKYLRDHIRDTVQPFGKTRKLFLKIYGPGPLEELIAHHQNKKSKRTIQEEWEELRKDIRQRARQTYA